MNIHRILDYIIWIDGGKCAMAILKMWLLTSYKDNFKFSIIIST